MLLCKVYKLIVQHSLILSICETLYERSNTLSWFGILFYSINGTKLHELWHTISKAFAENELHVQIVQDVENY